MKQYKPGEVLVKMELILTQDQDPQVLTVKCNAGIIESLIGTPIDDLFIEWHHNFFEIVGKHLSKSHWIAIDLNPKEEVTHEATTRND